jgi:hypothetical protein
MVMSKMASILLSFYSVSRWWPVLGSNKSNLGAIRFLLAMHQKGIFQQFDLKGKKEIYGILGLGNLRLSLQGEVSNWIHTRI